MIGIIIIGLIVGVIAKFLMPGNDPGGFVVTILLGIGGAVLASWTGGIIGFYVQGDGYGMVSAVLGAMIILFLYRVFNTKRKESHLK